MSVYAHSSQGQHPVQRHSHAGFAQVPPSAPQVSTSNATGEKGSTSAEHSHSSRVDVIDTVGGRILCVADCRGQISSLNALAAEHSAVAIIHTGDFGFYEPSSVPSISDRTLRHLVQYSALISPSFRSILLAPTTTPQRLRDLLHNPPQSHHGEAPTPSFALSEFPKLLSGELRLNVPVYTVWGACEDVSILEKIRLAAPSIISVPGEFKQAHHQKPSPSQGLTYSIPNLTVLDEATTRVLVIGGVRLRLFGLGGAVVSHKLFDNGSGSATIAGGGGTMWTTILQIGELVDTAQKVYDPAETRLLISHGSPGREGLLSQLALVLKADLTVSAGLHFRYGVSYNEFSVQHDPEAFKTKLENSKKSFNEVWDTVKSQVENVIDDNQKTLLSNALHVANRLPTIPPPNAPVSGQAVEEAAWKNCWNWNLPDAAFGNLVLDIREGRIGSELKSQGFNFSYRQNGGAHKAHLPAAAQNTTALGGSAPNVNTHSVIKSVPTASVSPSALNGPVQPTPNASSQSGPNSGLSGPKSYTSRGPTASHSPFTNGPKGPGGYNQRGVSNGVPLHQQHQQHQHSQQQHPHRVPSSTHPQASAQSNAVSTDASATAPTIQQQPPQQSGGAPNRQPQGPRSGGTRGDWGRGSASPKPATPTPAGIEAANLAESNSTSSHPLNKTESAAAAVAPTAPETSSTEAGAVGATPTPRPNHQGSNARSVSARAPRAYREPRESREPREPRGPPNHNNSTKETTASSAVGGENPTVSTTAATVGESGAGSESVSSPSGTGSGLFGTGEAGATRGRGRGRGGDRGGRGGTRGRGTAPGEPIRGRGSRGSWNRSGGATTGEAANGTVASPGGGSAAAAGTGSASGNAGEKSVSSGGEKPTSAAPVASNSAPASTPAATSS